MYSFPYYKLINRTNENNNSIGQVVVVFVVPRLGSIGGSDDGGTSCLFPTPSSAVVSVAGLEKVVLPSLPNGDDLFVMITTVGSLLGLVVDSSLGLVVGSSLCKLLGLSLGLVVGSSLSFVVGLSLGCSDGRLDKYFVGRSDGTLVVG